MSHYRRADIPGATYFFTVNLANRQSELLVAYMERLRAVYAQVQTAHPFTTIAICILPDHLHALWQLPPDDSNFALRGRLIKSMFSRGLTKSFTRSASKIKPRESGLWQRRYWEHCIRDERDLQQHIDYIHYNPVKHGHVSELPIGRTAVFTDMRNQGWFLSIGQAMMVIRSVNMGNETRGQSRERTSFGAQVAHPTLASTSAKEKS